MARGRMIDRAFMKSRKLNSVSRDHRLIYASILPFLDREGRIVAEPIYLKALVFRWSDFTLEEIAAGVAALEKVKLIRLYSDEDNSAILQYESFRDFNNPNSKESKSDLPGPDDPGAKPCRDESILEVSPDADATHAQNTGSPANVQVENGTERNDQRSTKTPPTPPAELTERDTPGEGEALQELANENSLKTLQRTQPGIWPLFEELSKIQGAQYRAKLAQASALLQAVQEHGADAVGSAMRTIISSAGDGGPLFGRVMALLTRNSRASPGGKRLSRADERLASTAADIYSAIGGDLN